MSRELKFNNLKSDPDDQPSLRQGPEELKISEPNDTGELAEPDDQPSGS